METGILGKKLGMTRIFTEDGRWIVVTLVEVGPCAIVQRKTREIDGYEAVQLGFGGVKESGHGAEGGIEGLEAYLTTKFITQLNT